MPSFDSILSVIALLLFVIFLIWMMKQKEAPVVNSVLPTLALPEDPANVRERNQILFRNSIKRMQQKLHPILKGALCNVLHDPLFEPILDEILLELGDLNCTFVIELLEETRELAIKEMDRTKQQHDQSKRNELDEVGRLVRDELTILITKLIEINCVEDVINAAIIRELVINSRDDVCSGLEISASVLSDFLRNMVEPSETENETIEVNIDEGLSSEDENEINIDEVLSSEDENEVLSSEDENETIEINPSPLLCDQSTKDERRNNGVGFKRIQYAIIFQSEEARLQVFESFCSRFKYKIRLQHNWSSSTHPDVYLIYFNDIERDFVLTLSPLVVSMECEVPLDPDMVYCTAMGCTDRSKWPHSFN
jgi:hypothetical protein